jgi:hypothetical protein
LTRFFNNQISSRSVLFSHVCRQYNFQVRYRYLCTVQTPTVICSSDHINESKLPGKSISRLPLTVILSCKRMLANFKGAARFIIDVHKNFARMLRIPLPAITRASIVYYRFNLVSLKRDAVKSAFNKFPSSRIHRLRCRGKKMNSPSEAGDQSRTHVKRKSRHVACVEFPARRIICNSREIQW